MDEQHSDLIPGFTKVLEDFESVIKKVPEGGLDWSEKEGEWSIRQIIHHVADDCNVYAIVLERTLVTPGCEVRFGSYPGNEVWVESLDYDKRPVTAALKLMHAHRAFLAELIGHFPDRWENTAEFLNVEGEKIAERSIREMVTMLTDHMQEHVNTIETILAAHKN